MFRLNKIIKSLRIVHQRSKPQNIATDILKKSFQKSDILTMKCKTGLILCCCVSLLWRESVARRGSVTSKSIIFFSLPPSLAFFFKSKRFNTKNVMLLFIYPPLLWVFLSSLLLTINISSFVTSLFLLILLF